MTSWLTEAPLYQAWRVAVDSDTSFTIPGHKRRAHELAPDLHVILTQHAQIEAYKPAAPFDVVVCYDVMQYLDSDTAARALNNFGKLCRGVLYFTALTKVDWQLNCDQSRTDSDVYLRSAQWYRSRLRPHFREAGCGFWLRRGSPFTVWDLESL